ncbi:MAG TPA: SDR family NAD(P)-dependent oxidoreductase [Candidatus Bathyarchaeia archaeon]|nr:SDR family NAD(P)-dependent oxidoreductase [Candidatus Bathyarchaeia archaeon]
MRESRVVLITGASSGFGRETARILLASGFKVYGTSRNPSGRPQEPGVGMIALDLDSDDSVKNGVKELLDETERLDVLVNNAGYVLTGGAEETSIAEAKAQFETDFFGHVRVTKALLPTMRKQGSGQIINISSLAAILPVPFEGYYAAAKAALLAWSEALRHEVKTFGIGVSVIEPGFFKTNLGNTRRNAKYTIRDYDELRQRATTTLDSDFENGEDPKIVAETVLKIVQSGNPKLEFAVGREKRYKTLKRILPQSIIENGVRRHWKLDK